MFVYSPAVEHSRGIWSTGNNEGRCHDLLLKIADGAGLLSPICARSA